jgi:hypothetical protein
MKLRSILFGFIFFLSSLTYSQTKIHYTLSAEAHALMCPFLSPKLMELLAKKGAVELYKDDQIQLHFTTTKDAEMSDELIFGLIDNIGYESKNFKIVRTIEN